jgi:predicted SnoaL-like aldol condensation-catalyzing enzyme
MSTANRALVRRWFEKVWNNGREDVIDEMLAPQAVLHNVVEPGQDVYGPEGFRRTSIQELVSEGDLVVVVGHDDSPRPPTVTIVGATVTGVENGKLVEGWDHWDRLSMMRQLSVLPASLGANA